MCPSTFKCKKASYLRKNEDHYGVIDRYIEMKMKHLCKKDSTTALVTPLPSIKIKKCRNEDYFVDSKFKSDKVPYKTFERLMETVKSKYAVGRYQDSITQSKERQRDLKDQSSLYQPEVNIEIDSDTDDEILCYKNYLETRKYSVRSLPVAIKSEFTQAAIIFRYLKTSRRTSGALLALCALSHMNNVGISFIQAVEEVNGIPLLLNLLDCKDSRCRIGVLKVLRSMCFVQKVCQSILELGGISPLIKNVKGENSDIKTLACDILSFLAYSSLGRLMIRNAGAIPPIIHLLICKNKYISEPNKTTLTVQGKVAQSAVNALWNCSKSRFNRMEMREAAIFPLLARLLRSGNPKIMVPVIGTLQQCADEQFYKSSIRIENLISIIVQNLSSQHLWLKTQCSLMLFSCSDDSKMQVELGKSDCLKKVCASIGTENDLYLLYGLTGTLWKCCKFLDNAIFLHNQEIPKILLNKLQGMPEKLNRYLVTPYTASETLRQLDYIQSIAINITGALSELSKLPDCREDILKHNGMEPLTLLLSATDIQHLLINTIRTLEKCAELKVGTAELDQRGGIRRLFTLLHHSTMEVKASAAWALVPCIKNTPNIGDMLRSFVGGIELVTDLLNSDDEEILSAACACICAMCKESDITNIVSDLGGIRLLTRLVRTTSPFLMYHTTGAIEQFAKIPEYAEKLGTNGIIPYLVRFLKSEHTWCAKPISGALYELSKIPQNCVEMCNIGLVEFLVNKTRLEKIPMSRHISGVLDNIRILVTL